MFGGSWRCAAAIAACTSCAAASMSRASVNCSVTEVEPRFEAEAMASRPAIVENCRSSGVATAEAIVSGDAPGSDALTLMVGKSTFGRSLTGNCRYAIAPKSRMAIMSSVVMTGRRMKISAMFMIQLRAGCLVARSPGYPVARRKPGDRETGRPSSFDFHLTLRCKPQLPVCHYRLAGGEAIVDDRFLADGAENGDGPHLDGVAGLHHINILPALSVLHGACGDDQRGVALRDFHRHGDELSGPERAVAVVERRFQRDRAGALVDAVVDERQLAARVAGGDVGVRMDGRKLILRNG